jgi:hypothetical protein
MPFVIARNQYWINCLASPSLLFSFFSSHGLPCLGVCLALPWACLCLWTYLLLVLQRFLVFLFVLLLLLMPVFVFVKSSKSIMCLALSFNLFMQLFNNIAAYRKE